MDSLSHRGLPAQRQQPVAGHHNRSVPAGYRFSPSGVPGLRKLRSWRGDDSPYNGGSWWMCCAKFSECGVIRVQPVVCFTSMRSETTSIEVAVWCFFFPSFGLWAEVVSFSSIYSTVMLGGPNGLAKSGQCERLARYRSPVLSFSRKVRHERK